MRVVRSTDPGERRVVVVLVTIHLFPIPRRVYAERVLHAHYVECPEFGSEHTGASSDQGRLQKVTSVHAYAPTVHDRISFQIQVLPNRDELLSIAVHCGSVPDCKGDGEFVAGSQFETAVAAHF